MKSKNLLPILFLSCPVLALADTFILKDGTEYEGKILRESADSYVLEVQITKSIKDEKTIAKEEIKEVRRSKPGEAEFKAIADLVPVPEQARSDEYVARIAKVEKYLATFRNGPKDKEAKEILATLKKEANDVLAGGIKLNGRMIPAQEYRPNAYEIDARAMAAKIENWISKSQVVPALRAFDEMRVLYPNTEAFTNVAPLVARAAQSHLAEVNRLLETYEQREQERKVGLERMAAADRAQTEAALAEQLGEFEKRLESEKAAKIGWVSVDPTFRPSLEATATYGNQVVSQIQALPAKPKVDAGKLYRKAYSAAHGGKADEAREAISAAKSAGVGSPYIEDLETAAAAITE